MSREEFLSAIYMIIKNENGEILFQRRCGSKLWPDFLGLPAGHVDKGEDVYQALVREAREELNIDINVKDIEDTFDLEADIITKHNVSKVWEYLKHKDLITTKVFYLYFAVGLKISEISKELGIGESNIKNRIYRTLKEIKKYLGKDVNEND